MKTSLALLRVRFSERECEQHKAAQEELVVDQASLDAVRSEVSELKVANLQVASNVPSFEDGS